MNDGLRHAELQMDTPTLSPILCEYLALISRRANYANPFGVRLSHQLQSTFTLTAEDNEMTLHSAFLT